MFEWFALAEAERQLARLEDAEPATGLDEEAPPVVERQEAQHRPPHGRCGARVSTTD
jgi:hypothetical protein